MKSKVIFFILIFPIWLAASINLEEDLSNFVLETKKIDVPGYPDAFNPSIINWGGSLLLSFRTRDPITGSTDSIGLTWLDERFNPVGPPYMVDKFFKNPASTSFIQDSRLIGIGNKVYVVYNNYAKVEGGENRRMCISELHYDGVRFSIKEAQCLLEFEGENPSKQEKNWVPFVYQGDLLLAYSLAPHLIFKPLPGSKKCETFAISHPSIFWKWGELRGGTPALLDKDRYLAFFHSCKVMATSHSKGKAITHYFMGAYTFSAHPPFEIKEISPKPIVGKNFYEGPAHNTWKPLRVVFPVGFTQDDQFIWLVYGRQDFESWVVKLDKQKLYQSLIPIQQVSKD